MDQRTAQRLFAYSEGELFWRESPRRSVLAGNRVGGVHASGYRYAMVNGAHWAVHHLVWIWHGRDRVKVIDHTDGNRANNRIENLRPVDASQNQQNRKLNANSATGAKGVTRYKGLFRVRLQVRKVPIYLGDFEDLEFAELVAILAREKYHGAFARHC